MIAQTYRPKTLDQVVGHEKIVKEIKDRFVKGNYPQVSYFTGLTGTGKTTLAFNIAKIIQCENKVNEFTPCNQCSQCNDINKENFNQGTYMYNASNLDIEAMRDIDESTNTISFLSNKKVIIIDEFQELRQNVKAQKNLLKALEKENKEVYFILLSMDDAKVDKAIKNRAVSYKLYPVDYMKVSEYLYSICTDLKISLDEKKSDILFTISQNSGGSLRQACAYLERVVEGNIWTEDELISVLNITTNNTLIDLCLMLIDKNPLIFEKELSEEIIQKIKWILIDFSKVLLGVKIDSYKQSSLKGLLGYKNASLKNVYEIIETLNEFFKFPYINSEIIESVLIKLFLINEEKSIQSVKEQQQEVPKRRKQEI